MKKYLKPLALLTIITIIFGAIYSSSQQVLRMSADDPQLQMAEDAATQLDHGATLDSIVKGRVDVKTSLAPFLIIYNKRGNAVANPAYIGEVPLINIPIGVLKRADTRSYNDVSWEPEANVRLAAVSVASHDYYVVGARSLKEIEIRIDNVGKIVALGWLASVLVISSVYYLRKIFSSY